MRIPTVLKRLGSAVDKNSPIILTGLSVIGVVTTVVFAINATPKANQVMAELRDEYTQRYDFGDAKTDAVPKMEVVKHVVPVYIPTIAMGALTIACMISATAIGSRRNAVLAGLYSGAQVSLKEYQDKVIETFGEKDEQKVRDGIAQDRINKKPVDGSQVILTGKGDALCYESLCGNYFMSDIEKIRRAENDFNQDLINGSCMWSKLNDLYYYLGLEPTDLGDYVGWDIDHKLRFDFSSRIATDGRPCLVIGYREAPREKYIR